MKPSAPVRAEIRIMKVTYTSEKYDPARQYDRYVRRDGNGVYYWCEVGPGGEDERRLDYRQGTVEVSEIPDGVRAAADALCGYFPSYVDWRMTINEIQICP
jgi:hypothetical protein